MDGAKPRRAISGCRALGRRLALCAWAALAAAAVHGSGCGSAAKDPPQGGGDGAGGGVELGQQIDRVGRDGINHAATDPFGLMELYSHQIRDAYNRAGDRAAWSSQFSGRIARSLALWDGIDVACGNQLAAAPSATPDRYDVLATVLVDDVLLVDTSASTCEAYLALERASFGQPFAGDCGGRTPLMDTVDVTMTLLAAGPDALRGDGNAALTDGVSSDSDGHASTSEFPFLLPPGTGTPGSSPGGGTDPEQGYRACANLGETRCAMVYKCWGRDGIPAAYRDAYAYDVAECARRMTAECRALATSNHGPSCPPGQLDPDKLRTCERMYAVATCDQVTSAGPGLLPCGSLCL